MGFGAQNKFALARFVGSFQFLVGDDIAAGREVRTLYYLHHVREFDARIVDVRHRAVDGFGEVVRGNVRG